MIAGRSSRSSCCWSRQRRSSAASISGAPPASPSARRCSPGGSVRTLAGDGPLRTLDLALIALLAAIAVQLLPLPAFLVSIVSPHRLSYIRAASLGGTVPAFLPLTLDRLATVHGWLATLCACLTFWTARAVFARGGLRTFVTALAWAAVAFVLVAFAQSASSTNLVYGFWQPHDAGARPFGPFINRNHAGTWSLLALFLCFGCSTVAPRGRAPLRAAGAGGRASRTRSTAGA